MAGGVLGSRQDGQGLVHQRLLVAHGDVCLVWRLTPGVARLTTWEAAPGRGHGACEARCMAAGVTWFVGGDEGAFMPASSLTHPQTGCAPRTARAGRAAAGRSPCCSLSRRRRRCRPPPRSGCEHQTCVACASRQTGEQAHTGAAHMARACGQAGDAPLGEPLQSVGPLAATCRHRLCVLLPSRSDACAPRAWSCMRRRNHHGCQLHLDPRRRPGSSPAGHLLPCAPLPIRRRGRPSAVS